jgi:hypothetical protein
MNQVNNPKGLNQWTSKASSMAASAKKSVGGAFASAASTLKSANNKAIDKRDSMMKSATVNMKSAAKSIDKTNDSAIDKRDKVVKSVGAAVGQKVAAVKNAGRGVELGNGIAKAMGGNLKQRAQASAGLAEFGYKASEAVGTGRKEGAATAQKIVNKLNSGPEKLRQALKKRMK